MALGAAHQRRIADHLLSSGVIRLDAHRAALAAASAQGTRVEDVLIDMGVVAEADLLKTVASLFSTRFVSTAKLAQATLDPRILALVPRRLAERSVVFPVLYDGTALTVAIADPDDLQTLEDVKVTASVREVRPIVARPAAIRAAIARGYMGDANAFQALLQSKPQGVVSAPPTAAAPAHPAVPSTKPRSLSALELAHLDATAKSVAAQASPGAQSAVRAAAAVADTLPLSVPPASVPLPASPEPQRAPFADPARTSHPDPARASHSDLRAQAAVEALPIDFVRALVDVLERTSPASGPERRGHSAEVARVCRKLAERLGLPATQRDAIALAGLAHDLGKHGPQHLTALHVAVYAAHKALGAQNYRMPEALLAPVELPADTRSAITSMYECFDGKGVPSGASGRQIPVGARVLAVADAYVCVTTSADHPGKKVLAPSAGAALLGKFSGKIFDPAVLDALGHVVRGEDVRAALLADRVTVLVVDPNPHARARLEVRLAERGFAVRVADAKAGATAELDAMFAEQRGVVVVSEIHIGGADDSVNLRAEMLQRAPHVPWFIYAAAADDPLLEFMRELDVAAIVAKSSGPDALVEKLVGHLEEDPSGPRLSTPRAMQASLADCALGELAELLASGRKTCSVQIRGQHVEGVVVFEDGNVVDARAVQTGAPSTAVRGEEAFFALMSIKEGAFGVDAAQVEGRTIFDASTAALVREGQRRLP